MSKQREPAIPAGLDGLLAVLWRLAQKRALEGAEMTPPALPAKKRRAASRTVPLAQ